MARPTRTVVALTIALATLATTTAGYVTLMPQGRYHEPSLDFVATEVQFTSPTPVLGDGNTGTAPDNAAIAAALQPLLSDPALTNLGISVRHGDTEVFARNAAAGLIPASTIKILTAAATLATFDPDHRFTTRVVEGSTPGEVVLVGGGDPTLAAGRDGTYPTPASLAALAAETTANRTAPITSVVFDTTLFSGAETQPGWDDDAVSGGYIAPVTALAVDGGRVDPALNDRSLDPSAHAGTAFAAALGNVASRAGSAPAGANEIASIDSAPVQLLVEQMLRDSDNYIAEVLARQVAVARGLPADFAGAAAAMQQVLTELGVISVAQMADGSGLSRDNRVAVDALTEVLALAVSGDERLRPLLVGLPVANYDGTLASRFDGSGAGMIRAKTGTLQGVAALAGTVRTADGQLLVFSVIANDSAGDARAGLDRIVAAIAACGC